MSEDSAPTVGASDIGHFAAFGYATLKQCIPATDLAALRTAFDRVMETAPRSDQFGTGATRVLSFGEDADPSVAALAGYDPLVTSLRVLFGASPLYIGSFLMKNCDDTPWHTTGVPGEGPGTIRVTVYLDESSEQQGALHVLPGSHSLDYGRAVFNALGYWDGRGTRLRGDPRSFPEAVPLSTKPGDVLVWYTRLWHASFKRADGKPRRGIFLSYVPDPGDDAIAAEKLRRIAQASRSTVRPYLYGDQLAVQDNPNIVSMARRLRELGVANVVKD